jgi:alkylation response protein AidB-like acyl-CoA dehydrogenase
VTNKVIMEIKETLHPATFIDLELVAAMRSYTAEAEKLKSLHPKQLDIIYEQKWFKLFVPKMYGGLELSLPEALKIEEALAWTDGSLGWTVTLCGGANWFVGFIDPSIAKDIFSDEKACLAGSGKISGTAKVVDGGYEISGHWYYATGSTHATAFTTNCTIKKDGELLKNSDGKLLIKSFVLPKENIELRKSWEYIGMAATASNSFVVDKVQVSDNRTFTIDKKYSVIDLPIYEYPFLNFAEATLAANNAGMAYRFLDLYEELVLEKADDLYVRLLTQNAVLYLEDVKQQFKKARQDFYTAVQQSWDAYLQKDISLTDKLQALSTTSRILARNSRVLVDELYPYCGLDAAIPTAEINRVWRNLHTVTQHPLLLDYQR